MTSDPFILGMYAAEVVAIDTETTGLDIRDGRDYAVGLSAAYRVPGIGVVSRYFPIRHSSGTNLDGTCVFELKEWFKNYRGTIVFHNSKFDLVSLATLGINYTGKFYDTLLMAHLKDHHELFMFSLEECSEFYLKKPGKEKSQLFLAFQALGWDKIPAEVMADYASKDTETTLELWEHLHPYFVQHGLYEKIWTHKSDFVRTVIQMEKYGVRIDSEICERQILLGESQMEDYKELLSGLNPASPKDLQVLLIEKLGMKQIFKKRKQSDGSFIETPTFDKDAMEVYEKALEMQFPGDTTAQYILGYRGWMKAVGYYKAYLRLISPDGRLRPNYQLHGTITGRMSCKDPNLQQIPKVSDKPWNGKIKKAFVPATGYQLWGFDYSQLELRLGAAAGRELALLKVFADEDRDVFSEIAATLGMSRYATKTLVYTINYGGGVTRLCEVFGVDPGAASDIRDNFFHKYPGLENVSRKAKRVVEQKGCITLPSGRIRSFKFPRSQSHKAFNAAIQGTAADVVERQMVRLHNEISNNDCRMLLQVHDEVVFEIREGMEDHYIPLIKKIMEDVTPDFGVKFKVDCKKWGEK